MSWELFLYGVSLPSQGLHHDADARCFHFAPISPSSTVTRCIGGYGKTMHAAEATEAAAQQQSSKMRGVVLLSKKSPTTNQPINQPTNQPNVRHSVTILVLLFRIRTFRGLKMFVSTELNLTEQSPSSPSPTTHDPCTMETINPRGYDRTSRYDTTI